MSAELRMDALTDLAREGLYRFLAAALSDPGCGTAGLLFVPQASLAKRQALFSGALLLFFAHAPYLDTFSTCLSSDVVKSFCFLHHDYVVHL